MPPHEVELLVDGVLYGGFKSGVVTFSLEGLAHQFQFSYTNRWVGQQEPWPIRAGDECEIRIDGEQLLTGFVERPFVQYSATSELMRVSGRSRTADMVDCSAVFPTSRWSNQTLDQILSDIGDPFGIRTFVGGNPKRLKRFVLNSGERAIDAIMRAAQIRGLFPYCDSRGNLRVDEIGPRKTETRLQHGINIISASNDENWSGRYSDYIYKGQRPGDDETFGEAASQLRAEVQDEELAARGRYRPLIVIKQEGESRDELQRRATWERNRRAGRSDRIVIVTRGYRNAEGFWQPNTLVTVDDERLELENAELLVTTARYRFDADAKGGGYVTELELTEPAAFSVAPYPRRRRRGRRRNRGLKQLIANRKREIARREAEEKAKAEQQSP